ncbi:MAG: hypothetical protein WCI95_09370 [bacterium]
MDKTLSQTTLAVDGHVHIYPQYDWAEAVTALLENLATASQTLAPRQNVIPIGLLAESRTNRFYNEVMEAGAPLSKGSLQVEAGPDSGSLVIRDAGTVTGYLIAGRQLVTSEKLEVLALGKDTTLSSGLPIEETLKTIAAQGAMPVLSWSPGKWFFKRGKLVGSLIASHPPGSFMLGDIGIRPTVWTTPRLMKLATQCGFKILGGSDSLPMPGEERWIGRAGFQVTGAFDPQKPAASVRALLQAPSSVFIPIGQHSSLIAFATRWGRNQMG